MYCGLSHRLCCLVFASNDAGVGGSVCTCSLGDWVEPCKSISEGHWLNMDAWIGLGLWGNRASFGGVDNYLVGSQSWGVHVDLGSFLSVVLAWARERRLGVNTSPQDSHQSMLALAELSITLQCPCSPQSALCPPSRWSWDLSLLSQNSWALGKICGSDPGLHGMWGHVQAMLGPLHLDTLSCQTFFSVVSVKFWTIRIQKFLRLGVAKREVGVEWGIDGSLGLADANYYIEHG